MAPDRILGKHPRFASYLILACALVIFGLSVWVYLLTGRVSDGEAIRRADAKNTAARQQLSLRFAQTLIDVSICLPLMNVQALLDSGALGPVEKKEREEAKARYLEKLADLKSIAPTLEGCDK